MPPLHTLPLRAPASRMAFVGAAALGLALLAHPASAGPLSGTPRTVERPTDAPASAPAAEPEAGKVTFAPSENPPLGEIVWVSPDGNQAVLYLDRGLTVSRGKLLTRDSSLALTALVQPVGLRRGRAVGVRILSGSAAEGDQVILPGPTYRKQIDPDGLDENESDQPSKPDRPRVPPKPIEFKGRRS